MTTAEISALSGQDFLDGQLLLIDKPLEWTSFDAVKKIRYLIRKRFDIKKIKVGHAGTLDPLATGILVICTGRFTKKITGLTTEDKSYIGTFTLGATTASYDLESEIEDHRPFEHLTEADIQSAAADLTGEQMQVPPVFSAKKVDGRRAYEMAREGMEVALKANAVNIKKFDVDASELPVVGFSIACTKGCYIRSIARDIGVSLEVGAYLSSLRRMSIGTYQVVDAVSPGAFEAALFG